MVTGTGGNSNRTTGCCKDACVSIAAQLARQSGELIKEAQMDFDWQPSPGGPLAGLPIEVHLGFLN